MPKARCTERHASHFFPFPLSIATNLGSGARAKIVPVGFLGCFATETSLGFLPELSYTLQASAKLLRFENSQNIESDGSHD